MSSLRVCAAVELGKRSRLMATFWNGLIATFYADVFCMAEVSLAVAVISDVRL